MKRFPAAAALSLAACALSVESYAQPFVNQSETAPVGPSYARTASLVIAAPLVIDATISRATVLPPERAPGVNPGHARFYIEANVLGLIRGSSGVAAEIAYLADVPLDSRGKPPKLKRLRVMLFARPVPGKPGEVQLVRPDGQVAWSPALDAQVRAIAAEVVRPDAAPSITGIGSAIHVPGSLVGEGETTIFLQTPDQQPVSLTIIRRPGQQRQWSVSLSEVVTNTMGPVRPNTLLWYRLACSLPEALPQSSLESMGPADAAIAREDYRFVLDQLGPCDTDA
ncbi:hypothetical protein [Sphingomonas gilva]|uniref:hypothetical protein n=1 Tax=Sphingomonas gilva TaxID=2305907 RepID=UPI001FE8DF9A|nr:hypothetical protein [Sphingomonas gilva]